MPSKTLTKNTRDGSIITLDASNQARMEANGVWNRNSGVVTNGDVAGAAAAASDETAAVKPSEADSPHAAEESMTSESSVVPLPTWRVILNCKINIYYWIYFIP